MATPAVFLLPLPDPVGATAFGSSYESIRAEVEEIQHTNEELKKENLLVKVYPSPSDWTIPQSTNEELTAQIAMLQDQVQTLVQEELTFLCCRLSSWKPPRIWKNKLMIMYREGRRNDFCRRVELAI